jgi:hypothetical protein
MYAGRYYLPRGYRPYGKHTYRQISGPNGYLANLETFAGHGMRGGWTKGLAGRDLYEVYSYGARIAHCYDGGQPSINLGDYSPTTTKHQNLCLAWLGNARLVTKVAA